MTLERPPGPHPASAPPKNATQGKRRRPLPLVYSLCTICTPADSGCEQIRPLVSSFTCAPLSRAPRRSARTRLALPRLALPRLAPRRLAPNSVREVNELGDAVGAAEVDGGGVVEVGDAEVSAAEVGADEVGAAEVGAAEVGEADVGAAEEGEAEVGVAEVGAAEVGADELGAAEVGEAEVGAAEVGVAEVGAAEVGAAQTTTPLSLPTRFASLQESEDEPCSFRCKPRRRHRAGSELQGAD